MKRCIRIWFMGAGCLLIFISHNAQALWPFGGGAQKKASIKKETSVADRIHEENRGLLEGMESQIEAYTKSADKASILLSTREPWRIWLVRKAVKPIVPDNKVDTCILGGSLLSLGVGLWVKSWLLDGCGVVGLGSFVYRKSTRLERKIDKVQETVDSIKQTGITTEKKVDALQGTASGISTQVSNLSDRLQSTGDFLRQAIDDGNTSLIQQYKSDLDVLQKQLQGYMNTENGNTRERIQSLQKTVDEYQGQINEKLGAIQRDFEDSLRGITNQLNAKTTAIDSLSAQMTENTTSIQNLTAGFEEGMSVLKKNDAQIRDLMAQRDQQQQQQLDSMLNMQSDIQQQVTTLTTLQTEFGNELRDALAKNKNDLASQLQGQYEQIQKNLIELLDTKFVTKEDHAESTKRIEESIKSLQQELAVSREENRKLREQVTTIDENVQFVVDFVKELKSNAVVNTTRDGDSNKGGSSTSNSSNAEAPNASPNVTAVRTGSQNQFKGRLFAFSISGNSRSGIFDFPNNAQRQSPRPRITASGAQ